MFQVVSLNCNNGATQGNNLLKERGSKTERIKKQIYFASMLIMEYLDFIIVPGDM